MQPKKKLSKTSAKLSCQNKKQSKNFNFEGAIFDLDGVIVNTVPMHFKAWKKMFAEYGRKFVFNDYLEKVDGIPRIDGAKNILTDLTETELKKATDNKQQYFLDFLNKSEIPVFKSTVGLIKKLKSNQIKIAVISSSKNCPYILKKTGLFNLFDIVLTSNDIKRGKPDPEIFLTAAERIGVNAKDCVVFEDALLGVEAAKRARMKCVGIDRQNKPERLKKADIIVKDLKEISFDLLKLL